MKNCQDPNHHYVLKECTKLRALRALVGYVPLCITCSPALRLCLTYPCALGAFVPF